MRVLSKRDAATIRMMVAGYRLSAMPAQFKPRAIDAIGTISPPDECLGIMVRDRLLLLEFFAAAWACLATT